jgi:hypothetical protein
MDPLFLVRPLLRPLLGGVGRLDGDCREVWSIDGDHLMSSFFPVSCCYDLLFNVMV